MEMRQRRPDRAAGTPGSGARPGRPVEAGREMLGDATLVVHAVSTASSRSRGEATGPPRRATPATQALTPTVAASLWRPLRVRLEQAHGTATGFAAQRDRRHKLLDKYSAVGFNHPLRRHVVR